MTSLRQDYTTPFISPHSVQQGQQPLRSKVKRPTTPPPRRISQAPGFTMIHEAHSSEEEDRIAALSTGRPSSSLSMHSRLPIPVLETLHETPDPWHKKTSRRKSGYLEGLQRPPSPSPGSPVTKELKALSARMTDDGEDFESEVEGINALPDSPTELQIKRAGTPLGNGKLGKTKQKQSSPPVVDDRAPSPELVVERKVSAKPAKKATGLRRVGLLKDMTNSNNYDNGQRISPIFTDFPKPLEGMTLENISTHIDTPAMPAQSLPSMHTPAGSVGTSLSTFSMDDMSDDQFSTASRERRVRKSVNYAEPSLKV